MSHTHIKRLDHLIAKVAKINNTLRTNLEVEFDIDHLLPIVETSVEALAQEIDDELEDK